MERDPLTARELEVWRTVLRMRRRLDRELDAHLASEGTLREADFEVLRSLYEEPGHALRVGTLAEQIEWEPSRLSHKLTQMERHGLVERRRSVRDARGSVAVLTPEGVEAYEAVKVAHRAWVKDTFFAALTDDQSEDLQSISIALLDKMAAQHMVDRPAPTDI